MKLNITGAADTQKLIRIVQERMAKQGIRRAVRAGATVIKEAIEERTPVQAFKAGPNSDALEPGQLKDDIAVRMKTEDGDPVAVIGPSPTTAHVARFLEYGHNISQSPLMNWGRRTAAPVLGFVPAMPFIRPGYESSRDEARAAFALEAGKQLKEAVKS